MLCLIDNYDSFTYNIVHYLEEIGVEVKVIRNDEMSAKKVIDMKPSHILLSPGPGAPEESGITMEVLSMAAERGIPTLGVCLGHEIVGVVFGGRVVQAERIMHGKTSLVRHNSKGVFKGLPSEVLVGRYHSLIIEKDSVPDCLNITSYTTDETGAVREVMGLSHKTLPIEGIQFHPESILTNFGHQMLANFVDVDFNQASFASAQCF